MKKLLLALSLTLALAGCATTKPDVVTQVVTKDKLITVQIPAEHLVIPDPVAPIDLKKSTQKDVATWITNTEARSKDMETKLKAIKQIQDQQVNGK